MIYRTTPPAGLLLFLIFLAFSGQSCTSPREKSIKKWEKTQWRTVKTDKRDTPTWVIRTRELAGKNFLEYKIEGEIEASPTACISSFKREIHTLADDPKNKKYPTYDIAEESAHELLTYVIHKEPFPLKNTEMSIRYLFSPTSESSGEGVEWTEDWNATITPPASRKLSRVETFRGDWSFVPTPTNFSKAVSHVRFDPKRMPMWLVEPMVVKLLVAGLTNLREMTSQENDR
ncbi:SRPBCC family protein [Neolewinella antarctica]|uniref:START domain-containing protein n=1 Tax=Neolewinella antarctica TaxID=442734 RepID=A0ABX0X8M7_9BACT|nr:hypothetical protein [Neolewinella antarctica]NJC25613.1 hypothetical protein [Neolewinella antarctica]